MELLGLKLRLKKGIYDPQEMKNIKDRIGILEKELGMN